MRFFILILLPLLLSIPCTAQTQLDILGDPSSVDTVAKIKVNFSGEVDVVGLSVYSAPNGSASYWGIGGSFYGGWRGIIGRSDIGYGVFGISTSGYGVFGQSTSKYGVYGTSISKYGVYGTSISSHGSYFRGKKVEGFADIILGAKDGSGRGDNGVIMSDPAYGSSDILLISNDAVIIELDNNRDETGNFFIKAGDNSILFQVDEFGNVKVKGSTVHSSDRHQKEDIAPVDYHDILHAIQNMPVYEWQFKEQSRRHIGPMAQDFHAAFGLGDDDKTIDYTDADGVALAAIKAQQEMILSQQERIESQQVQIESQQSQIDVLRQKMVEIKSLLKVIMKN